MITSIIIVRLVSKAEYGLYQQFLLIGTTFINILSLSLNSSLYYFFPTESVQNQKQFVFQTVIVQFIMGLTFVVLFLGFGIPRLQWLNLENLEIWKWHIGMYILLMLGTSIFEVIFTLEKKVKYNRIFYPAEKIIRMSLIVSLIFFLQDNEALIYAMLVLAVLRFVYLLYYMRSYLFNIKIESFSNLKNQLIYALPIAASLILRTISDKIDKFIVNDFVDLNHFAIYSVAYIAIPFLTLLYNSISNSTMPQIAIYCKSNQLEKAANLWKKTVVKNASVTIPIVFFAFFMANEIIEVLYTKRYLESAKYFKIFLLIYLFLMFNRGVILRGLKKTKLIFLINLFSTILTVFIGYLLIPKYLLFGASFTALAGICIPIISVIIAEKHVLGIPWKHLMEWNKIFQLILISLISLLIVFGLKFLIQDVHLTLISAGLAYVISIYYWQKKYDLLLFPNLLSKLLSPKGN